MITTEEQLAEHARLRRIEDASPDLLAVCQRIVAEHDSDGEISIGCIEDARAAIAKAEGRE